MCSKEPVLLLDSNSKKTNPDKNNLITEVFTEHMTTTKAPTYSEIAKQIIKTSIRSAICIDDSYGAPYEESSSEWNFEEPKQLYYSFRKSGPCDLDIYRFKGSEEWDKHKHLTNNRDLMVLDWELDQTSAPKYQDTLEILDRVIGEQTTPFVVIYTNTPDLSDVSKVLLQRYNWYNDKNFGDLIEKLVEKFEGISDAADSIHSFFQSESVFFHDYVKNHELRVQNYEEFISRFIRFLSLEEQHHEKCPKKLVSSIKELFLTSDGEDCILVLANIFVSRERSIEALKVTNVRVEIESLCYSINGVITLILHKQQKTKGISPDTLFDTFSDAICNNPHNIINLISIELKDKFREDFSKIGTNFNTVSEKAFLYHASNHINQKDGKLNLTPFRNFVIRSWVDELLQHNLRNRLDSFGLIEGLLKDNNIPVDKDLHYSLAEYAAMVSSVSEQSRYNWKLGFGDLFQSGDHFFMCITPHCDCFEPFKIRNQFYFTHGEKINLESALKTAEQDFYSFFFNNGKVEAVKWDCKPFTTYISDNMNVSDNKQICYAGNSFEVKLICSVKENYAQRIANNSFGYGHRVGIDLPHLKPSTKK
jgi:Response receiver domain